MGALGWVTFYKDGIVGHVTDRASAIVRARDDETVCAVVPADEWEALNDLDAAVERVVELKRALLAEHGLSIDAELYARDVRPIVLAALGRAS